MELSDLARQGNSVQAYFQKLFEMRDSLHFSHLAQNDLKLSTHLALGEMYDAILPIVDGLVEGYCGINNRRMKLSAGGKTLDDPVSYLENCYAYLSSGCELFSESWMENEIDEILKIIAIGLYKLRFLN